MGGVGKKQGRGLEREQRETRGSGGKGRDGREEMVFVGTLSG